MGSESSFGSEHNKSLHGIGRPQDDDMFEGTTSGATTGLFGVLYTVSKEKRTVPLIFVVIKLAMDFLQLFLIMVNPQYGWHIDGNSKWWKVVSFIQLNAFMMARGRLFFLICVYVMVVLLVLNMLLSLWVAWSFQHNSFDHVWPIKVLRLYSSIFFNVFDIASMSLFLINLDCQYFDTDNNGYNQEFPDIYCWSMPNLIHVAVSAVSLVGFVVLAVGLLSGEMELNPLSRNLLAVAHSKNEVVGFLIKVFMTCTSTFITNLKWMSVFQCASALLLLWRYFKWEPFIHNGCNYVRVASYTAVFYCSVLLVFLRHMPGIDHADDDAVHDWHEVLTQAMWYGLGPAFAIGFCASWLRLHYLIKVVPLKFRRAPPGTKPKYIFRFTDPRQVEIVARCVRRWIDEDTVEPEAIRNAEAVIKAGSALLPNNCFMTILHSSFLIEVQGSYQSGYTQLQSAKKQDPSPLERFAIFSREQEHTQKESGAKAGVGSGVDLVSYVEFQRNHRLVMRMHKEALHAIRGFWQALMHSKVTFVMLSKAITRIELHVHQAERVYRMVLERHTNNSRLLRLYALFLQDVKNDPWSAARWFGEAEKLEAQEETLKEKDAFGLAIPMDQLGFNRMNDTVAVVLINAHSEIQMANRAMHNLLGFKKQELKGKNIDCLVPPPFNEHHSSYVRTFIATGRRAILDVTSDAIAMHKDRSVLPVKVTVHQVSGVGEDAIFMGIMEPQEPTPNQAKAWILSNGVFASFDSAFTDWFGYKPGELMGSELGAFITDAMELNEELRLVQQSQPKLRQAPGLKAALRPREGLKSVDSTVRQQSMARRLSALMWGGRVSIDSDTRYTDGLTRAYPPGARRASSSLPPQQAPPTPVGASGKSVTHALAVAPSARSYTQNQVLPTPQGGLVLQQRSPIVRMTRESEGGALPGSSADGKSRQPGLQVHMDHRQDGEEDLAKPSTVHDGTNKSARWGNGLQPVCPSFELECRHRFGNLCRVEVTMRMGTIGNQHFHELSFQRLETPTAPEPTRLMFVCDRRGRLVHVTQDLAALLNTSPAALQGGNTIHMLDTILPQPWAQLHHAWVQDSSPATASIRSCRAGLTMCLIRAASIDEPTKLLPFKLNINKRGQVGMEQVNVVTVQPRTMEQALDERRLKLRVDAEGHVIAVGASDAKLFGCEPSQLMGRHVSSFLDVMRNTQSGNGDGFSSCSEVLMELAQRSVEQLGVSWRVGVHLPLDESDMQRLGAVGAARLLHHMLPAVMTLTPSYVFSKPLTQPPVVDTWSEDEQDILEARTHSASCGGPSLHTAWATKNNAPLANASLPAAESKVLSRLASQVPATVAVARASTKSAQTMAIPPALLLEASLRAVATPADGTPEGRLGGLDSVLDAVCFDIELWKSSMLTGVVEVNSSGRVVATDVDPLCPPGLVFGVPDATLAGHHVSGFLPVPATCSPAELFKQLSAAAASGALSPQRQATALRPGMKNHAPKNQVGVENLLKCEHEDGKVLQVAMTAVHKEASSSSFLVLHVTAPRVGRRDFWQWLWSTTEMRSQAAAQALALDSEDGAGLATLESYRSMNGRQGMVSRRLMRRVSQPILGSGRRRTSGGGGTPAPNTPIAHQSSMQAVTPLSKPKWASGEFRTQLDECYSPLRNATRWDSASPAGNLPSPGYLKPPRDLEMPDRMLTPLQGATRSRPAAPAPGAVPKLALPSRQANDPLQNDPLTTARDVAVDINTARSQPAVLPLDDNGDEFIQAKWGSGAPPPPVAGGVSHARTAAWVLSDGELLQPGALTPMLTDRQEDSVDENAEYFVKSKAAHSSFGRWSPEESEEEEGQGGEASEEQDRSLADNGGDNEDKAGPRAHSVLSRRPSHKRDDKEDGYSMNEAGDGETHYKRGKRFRKLCKHLGSAQFMRVLKRFQTGTLLCLGFLFLARIVTFIVMLFLLKKQSGEITDLYSIGLASKRVHEIVIRPGYASLLYANETVPGLRRFDNATEGVEEAREELKFAIGDLRYLHQGTFYGFKERREMSQRYGLRELWNNPNLVATDFQPTTPNMTIKNISMSLWDLGNRYIGHGSNIEQNAASWNATGLVVGEMADTLWVQANGLGVLWDGYYETLNDFVDVTVEDNQAMNNVHIIIICVEGILLTVISVVYMWRVAQAVDKQRYTMYSVFMAIPMGLVRSLATRPIQLEEEDGDDEDEDPNAADQAVDQAAAAGALTAGRLDDHHQDAPWLEQSGVGADVPATTTRMPHQGSVTKSVSLRMDAAHGHKVDVFSHGSVNMHLPPDMTIRPGVARGGMGSPAGAGGKGAADWTDAGRRTTMGGDGSGDMDVHNVRGSTTFFTRIASAFRSGHHAGNEASVHGKRVLLRSYHSTIWMVWPFILWGCFVIALNAVRFISVAQIEPSIALLNVVNCVLVRSHHVLYETMMFAATNATSPQKQYWGNRLTADLALFNEEVAGMLYGKEVLNLTDPAVIRHFSRVTKGVATGASVSSALLYGTEARCLCEEESDCLQEDHPYYEYVSHGLEPVIKQFVASINTLLGSNVTTANMSHPAFAFIWTVAEADMEGGLTELTTSYLAGLYALYDNTVLMHIMQFVVSVVFNLSFIIFMLRPFMQETRGEAKRIAELLAQLPPEMDVETIVIRTCNPQAAALVPAGGDATSQRKSIQLSRLHTARGADKRVNRASS